MKKIKQPHPKEGEAEGERGGEGEERGRGRRRKIKGRRGEGTEEQEKHRGLTALARFTPGNEEMASTHFNLFFCAAYPNGVCFPFPF